MTTMSSVRVCAACALPDADWPTGLALRLANAKGIADVCPACINWHTVRSVAPFLTISWRWIDNDPKPKSDGYEPPSRLIELADEFLDLAERVATDYRSDELITHCLACNDVEGHRDWCPVPALERFMKTTPTHKED